MNTKNIVKFGQVCYIYDLIFLTQSGMILEIWLGNQPDQMEGHVKLIYRLGFALNLDVIESLPRSKDGL